MSRRSKDRREARRAKERARWPEAQRKARHAAPGVRAESAKVKTVRRGAGNTTAVKP